MSEVKQIGNYENDKKWDNPQTGRVYCTTGLSPTINTCGGGGHEVKIIELGKINSSQDGVVISPKGIAKTLTSGHGNTPKILAPIIVASRGRNPNNPSDRTPGEYVEQRLEPNSEGICNTLTSVQKDNLVLENCLDLYNNKLRSDGCVGTLTANGNISTTHCGTFGVLVKQATKEGYTECELGGVADLSHPKSKTRRERVQGKGNICPTITSATMGIHRIESLYRIRKLTPLECWRLMGFSDEDFFKAMLGGNKAVKKFIVTFGRNYGIKFMMAAESNQKTSNTQLYKQAGNSIVKPVLMGIFKQMIGG